MGECGTARSGIGFPDIEQGGSKGVPFFKVSDMNKSGNEQELRTANNYVTDSQVKRMAWNPVTEVPAMFFAKVGAAVMLNRKRLVNVAFLLDNNTMAYSFDKVVWDARFGKSLFDTLDLTKLIQVGALPSYNASDVEEMDIYIPVEKSEQAQIGAYFQQLDKLITLHQRKHQPYGIIQAFNERADTANSWEQRKLGEFTQKRTTKNADRAISETFTNSAEHGVISQLDFFDHGITNDASIEGYYLVQPDSFVYNPRISTTAPCGPINRNCLGRTGVISPLYTVFEVDETVDKSYLAHYFKTSLWHSFMFLEGNSGARSDRFSIADSTFFEMPISCPSLNEQRGLSTFLSQLDDLITLHQRKLVRAFIYSKPDSARITMSMSLFSSS